MLDTILDKSVVGYTALGYRLRSHPRIDEDLTGRFAIVTGATSGLGRQTASELARLGASAVLVGRNPEKTEAVVESIRRETGSFKLRCEIEAPARIVNVSSGGMYTQRVRVDDLQMKTGRYDGTVAYARAKRGRSTGQFWHDRRPRPTHRFKGTRETPAERESLWTRLTELSGWSGTLSGLAEAS